MTTESSLRSRESRHEWPEWKELFVIVLFWTLLASVSALNRLMDRPPGALHMRTHVPVLMAFAEAYAWALMTPFVFWMTSRYGIDRSNWGGRAFLYVMVGVACAFTADMVLDLTRTQLFPVRAQGRGPGGGGGGLFLGGRGSSPLWFLHEMVMYLAVLTAGIARDYVYREQARREETAALQVQLSAARLNALRMQLNPHFLFNTLHAISALVERDPAGVRKMIARLSELLRYTLDQAERAEVPLEKELAFVRGYLEIMKIRFQGHLEVDWDIAPGVEGALVPTLILQPLVENSIKHGVRSAEDAGRIEIRVRRSSSRLILTVRDSGTDAPVASVEQSSGVGLRNTEERLRQMYGDRGVLQLESLAGGGTEATIEIPWREVGDRP